MHVCVSWTEYIIGFDIYFIFIVTVSVEEAFKQWPYILSCVKIVFPILNISLCVFDFDLQSIWVRNKKNKNSWILLQKHHNILIIELKWGYTCLQLNFCQTDQVKVIHS